MVQQSTNAASGTDTGGAGNTIGTALLAVPIVLPAIVTAVVESGLVYAYAKGLIDWSALLIGHAAIVGLLVLWVAQVGRAKRNAAMPLVTAIAVAATGPIGAIAALAMIAFSRPTPEDQALLAAWYERIAMAVDTDEVTKLFDQVATGRTANLAGASPPSFASIMQNGTLADRQTALGVIARSFHPDHLPVLMLALKSEEPVIRVQAAAVATKVRGDLHALVDRLAGPSLQPLPGTSAAVSAANQLRSCLASGLLDEGDRIRASVITDRLSAATAIAQPTPPRSRTHLRTAPVIERYAIEDAQLRAGQFSQIRVGRRLARIDQRQHYRVRRASVGRVAAPKTSTEVR